jgi:phage terminase large subunit-like protein
LAEPKDATFLIQAWRHPAGREVLASLPNPEAEALERDWPAFRRAKQMRPRGRWQIWVLLAGRGFGKTRAGAEWVRLMVEGEGVERIALVAPTQADARNVMVEGESGILAVSHKLFRPLYEPSKRRLVWPNGARATLYSADEPDRLRGPQHEAAWCDEVGAWRYDEAWTNLLLGLRLGPHPRCIVTTTPRTTRLMRGLVSDATVPVDRGATRENAFLPPSFLNEMDRQFKGTRLGRQELEAELLEEVANALWKRAMFEREGMRVDAPPALVRIVVAIDPAASADEDADETGIVVAGVSRAEEGYVLADLSGRFSPPQWAARALDAYRDFRADRIVAEVNFGGDMVEAVLRALDPTAAFKPVHAARGKVARAEPVAALYERGLVHHVGPFPALEDQLCEYAGPGRGPSPDRLDALVWALTELMLGAQAGKGMFEYYRREAEKALKERR